MYPLNFRYFYDIDFFIKSKFFSLAFLVQKHTLTSVINFYLPLFYHVSHQLTQSTLCYQGIRPYQKNIRVRLGYFARISQTCSLIIRFRAVEICGRHESRTQDYTQRTLSMTISSNRCFSPHRLMCQKWYDRNIYSVMAGSCSTGQRCRSE